MQYPNDSVAATTESKSTIGSTRVELPVDFLRNIVVRASMRIRVSQHVLTTPMVLLALLIVDLALLDRVDAIKLHVWAVSVGAGNLVRSILSATLRNRIDTAPPATLGRYETYLFATAVFNAIAVGSGFWLVAAHGDLTVKLVITLISCFYAIGTLVNASSHFPSFVVVTSINLGQGVLFWLGLGESMPVQLEIAIPFLSVALLIVGFAKSNSRQFVESLRIRTENIALLAQLENEKQTVEKALREARHASESKSRFLAAASHDLRQPLHALTMFLGTLSFHVTTDDAKRLLGRIKDTTDVLREQFDSLLDLSKFDAGAVHVDLAPFELATMTEKLIEEVRPQAESKGIVICTTIEHSSMERATARSDAVLIERVLRNLIANAIKYTHAGSIAVSVREQDGEYRVAVSDTGPGIPPEQQSKIFEEYVQLGNPARQRRHGVGLGLAIVKRIDALLGLRLTLQSSLGSGSTFAFSVPISKVHAPTEPIRAHDDSNAFRTTATIWVLDDDPSILEAFDEQLSAWGATVATFSNPDSMIAALRAVLTPPRWIFTDDMLGSALSGLETAQMLSREFGFGRVCLITGNTEPERLRELRSSGFPVIVKPARPESLVEVLQA